VSPGTWLVGEKGPELLTLGAGAKGYVTPNSGMGGTVVHVTTSAPITDTTRFAVELQDRIRLASSLVKL
jgi:hypothetical protein